MAFSCVFIFILLGKNNEDDGYEHELEDRDDVEL